MQRNVFLFFCLCVCALRYKACVRSSCVCASVQYVCMYYFRLLFAFRARGKREGRRKIKKTKRPLCKMRTEERGKGRIEGKSNSLPSAPLSLNDKFHKAYSCVHGCFPDVKDRTHFLQCAQFHVGCKGPSVGNGASGASVGAAADWISIQTSAEYSVLKRRKRIEEGGGDYPAPKMTKEVGSGSPLGPISARSLISFVL